MSPRYAPLLPAFPQHKTYRELAKDIVVRLGRIGIAAHGALEDAEPKTPDVALHAVRAHGPAASQGHLGVATSDALGSHVALAADVGLGDAGHQVARHAKVAQLDGAARVDQDVGRLDVAVDDVVVVLERLEPDDGGVGDLAQYALGHAVAVQLVDRAAVHVLHADVDGALLEEGAVEVDDVGRPAAVQHVQLHDDLGKLVLVQL